MGRKAPAIRTTKENPLTYNSSNIHSFLWREREDDEKYEHGQLIVKFRRQDESRHQEAGAPQSTYTYDAPYKLYEEMRDRAENVDQEDSRMTLGEWFNSGEFERYLRKIGRVPYGSSNLYVDKLNMS